MSQSVIRHFLLNWKFLENFAKNLPIFRWKTPFFADSAKKNWYPNFERKNQLLLQFCPKWSNFWYKWSWVYLAEKWRVDFWFFVFLQFYWTRKLPSRHFFGKIGKFCQKSADSATFGSNKIAKNKKLKIYSSFLC